MEIKKEELELGEREMLRRFSLAVNHFKALSEVLHVEGVEAIIFQAVLTKNGLGVPNATPSPSEARPMATPSSMPAESDQSVPQSSEASPQLTDPALPSA